MKKFLLCIVAVVLACHGLAYASEKHTDQNKDSACSVSQAGEKIDLVVSPPLLELLVRPARYDGCTVVVAGYLSSGFPTASLYLSKEDRGVSGMLFGRIPLSFRNMKQEIDLDRMREADGNFVLVQGTFHIGSNSSSFIGEIERANFDTDPKRATAPSERPQR